MWSGHSSDQTGVLDVTIQCQLNMATKNLKEISTNITPAAAGTKFSCQPASTPTQGYNCNAFNAQESTCPYYENVTPTKTFYSCEYAADRNFPHVYVTPTARSAFQPVNPNVKIGPAFNGQISNGKTVNVNSSWDKFIDRHQFLNDSGYGSPGADYHYSRPCQDFKSSDCKETTNQSSVFDQQCGSLNSLQYEQQFSASCTFRNSMGTSFPVPADNRVENSITTCAKRTSSDADEVFLDDDMKIAMKEKDVTQRLYMLKVKGYESAQEVEDFYQSQTTVIDIERHNVLRQMAYDKMSSESINGYFNRKLLSVLESVEQKLSELEQSKSKVKQSQKKSRLLPKAAVNVLESWYQDNLSNPYPSREVTLSMAAEGGITVEQIRKWFANKRNRSRNSKLKIIEIIFIGDEEKQPENNNFFKDNQSKRLKCHMMDSSTKNFTKVFATLDWKGRGIVYRRDVIRALQLLKLNPTVEEIEFLLQKYQQQEFNYDQFVELVSAETRRDSLEQRKIDLRQAFSVFDHRDSGYLQVKTFRVILTQCGSMPLTEQEADDWIQLLDRRKDGLIRLAELEELLLPDEDSDLLETQQNWVAV